MLNVAGWTAVHESLAFIGAVAALVASGFQSHQALRKARIELERDPHGVDPRHWKRGREPQPRAWPLDLWIAWRQTGAIDESSSLTERSIKHFVNVSLLWFVILLGGLLAAAAAFIELLVE